MDAVFNQAPSLKAQLKEASDIIRSGNILGIGPNGEVEELLVRGNLCAGKKLHGTLLDISTKESNILEKLATDCNQLSRLGHPNVAAFFGLYILDNVHDSSKSLVLIREYSKGTLTNLLEANPLLPLSVKTSILLDVTKALDYLHMSKPAIVHCNLASTNVLITDSMQAKVADMECACFNKIHQVIEKQQLAFLPPEANQPLSSFEAASDMFSFGHIALHSAIHTPPDILTQGLTEIEKRAKYIAPLKNVDKILGDLIVSCLQISPKKRPTASSAMKDLRQLEQKLACKGDKYHSYMKRMTMYEMIGNMMEDRAEIESLDSGPDQIDDMQRRVNFNVSQIKGGVPNVLLLHEMVTTMGIRGIKKQQKWMEYKFEISAAGFLQYSKLNGQVLKRVSMEDIIYITAHRRLGDLDVYPFHVRFRPNDCWILGAHNEEMRKSWMEAILPGSTHNQWCDCPSKSLKPHQPLKRSATSPIPIPIPIPCTGNDPGYIKYNEINVPDSQGPPPVPERPADITKGADNPYLKILPSSTDINERNEAVASYTLEQVHLMIEMFEQNVQVQPFSPQRQPGETIRKRTCSETGTKATQGVALRNDSVNVSEQSNKHPSKGLYLSFAAITEEMDTTATDEQTASEETELMENTISSSKLCNQDKQSYSTKKGFSRQNAVSFSTTKNPLPVLENIKDETNSTETKSTLRRILRQQSSEELLEDIDKPEWSKAQLEDIEHSTGEHSHDSSHKARQINSLSIASKDLHDFSSIAIGQYGAVYRASLIDHTSTSKTVIVAVKTIREHSQEEWIDLLQTVSILRNPHHPNIAEVFGAVPENNWIVMEYTALGDLKRHLICNKVATSHLIKYMCDVAMGMHYIKMQGLVHKNLALRNVLITEDHTCKVADLGMRNKSFSVTRFDLGLEVDQRRWMSPENLYRGLFSEASDVWSFGVVQWEMFQPTRAPYSTLNSSQFPQHINSGHTLDIPDVCPHIVAKIMRACWNWNASKRPSFMYIASLLMQRSLSDKD